MGTAPQKLLLFLTIRNGSLHLLSTVLPQILLLESRYINVCIFFSIVELLYANEGSVMLFFSGYLQFRLTHK